MESPINVHEFTSMMIEKSSDMPLEENYMKISKQAWKDETQTQLKILDPNDPIMNRFQDALRAHLTRIDNKLSEEIHELVCFLLAYIYNVKINIYFIFVIKNILITGNRDKNSEEGL